MERSAIRATPASTRNRPPKRARACFHSFPSTGPSDLRLGFWSELYALYDRNANCPKRQESFRPMDDYPRVTPQRLCIFKVFKIRIFTAQSAQLSDSRLLPDL